MFKNKNKIYHYLNVTRKKVALGQEFKTIHGLKM